MKYASLGSSIVDNIIRRDGTRIENIAGGMAVFAYAGMRLYTDDVMLLTGVGDDYDRFYGDWIERNSVPRQGLIRRHEHTMNIVLSYDDDKGGYVTHSIYGDDEHRARHQAALDIGGEALEPFAKDIEWLYLGWNWLQDRPGIDKLKEKYGFKIMWEINSRIDKSYMPVFLRHMPYCDIWSLNRTEAFALFEVDSDEKAIERIREFGKPCYYRVGTDGAYMVTADEAPLVPMITVGEDVDATGCGNTSTGAAMWAYAEGYDPLMVGVLAAVAAGYNARQYGFIADLSPEVRAEAMALAEKKYRELKSL